MAARPPNRKRQRTDDPEPQPTHQKRRSSDTKSWRRPSREERPGDTGHIQTPVRESRGEISSKKRKSSAVQKPNFPSEFYDKLSKIWPTARAMRELNRRNRNIPLFQPTARPRLPRGSKIAALTRRFGSQLVSLAAEGGPDLSDLRGYQNPECSAMASTSSSSRRTGSTKATTLSSRSKRSSAYDANFEQLLIDNNIYPLLYDFPDDRSPPLPANWEDIRATLGVPRGSLSPSRIPQSSFNDFQRKNRSKSEGVLMHKVVPFITGDCNILNEGQLLFTNLDSITENTTVNPAPDVFDGAWPGAIDKKVRRDLDRIIVPTKKSGVPVAPNFFLEAKGPSGTVEVAEAQAVLDSAYGALIMHTLQNYLEEEPLYDGNAYAFSSTLVGGLLTLNAHHLTAPDEAGRPEYYTTELKAYAIRDNDILLEGIGAFRNLRKLAQDYRDKFIEVANARARK